MPINISTPSPGLPDHDLAVETWRAALAEGVGTFFLLAAVVGSGIAATRLSPGQTGLDLLENAIATGAVLGTLIMTFGPLSGAHFNPVVSLLKWIRRDLSGSRLVVYLIAQLTGAVFGTMAANLMFALPVVSLSTTSRATPHLWGGEIVATLGLLLVVVAMERHSVAVAGVAVGGYITGAYFFTSSTSFANPAVTLARSLTNSFAGIRPSSTPGFIGAQLLGLVVALLLLHLLTPRPLLASSKGHSS